MKRAVSKSSFVFGLLLIAVLASVVIAENITQSDTSATIVLSPDQEALVQSIMPEGAAVEREVVSVNNHSLSSPLEAIKACREDGCTTTGYLAATSLMDTTGYNCTVTDDGKVYLTCDSIYDGNGDGICTSGESCIQFGIVGSYVTRKERNSQDTFVEYDTSYVMPRAEVKE